MSGITTCSREPSGSVASTNGGDRSTRRPDGLSIRSTRSRTSSAVRIVRGELGDRRRGRRTPWSGSLIQISSTVGVVEVAAGAARTRPTASSDVTVAAVRSREGRQAAVQRALVVVGDRVAAPGAVRLRVARAGRDPSGGSARGPRPRRWRPLPEWTCVSPDPCELLRPTSCPLGGDLGSLKQGRLGITALWSSTGAWAERHRTPVPPASARVPPGPHVPPASPGGAVHRSRFAAPQGQAVHTCAQSRAASRPWAVSSGDIGDKETRCT